MKYLRAVLASAALAAATIASATDTIWVDDTLPAGAIPGAAGGDTWNWVTSAPAPFSGSLAHQSSITKNKFHEMFFSDASATLQVRPGDVLFAHVFLDPANPPNEIMLAWRDGTDWEHRAYWGANRIHQGTNNTASRYPMGALPATGRWVRLEVPAALVGLEGKTINGMRFMLHGGRATWDRSGVRAGQAMTKVAAPTLNPAGGTFSSAQSVTIASTTSGATIRYTTDGSNPSANWGTVYTAPISIGDGTTTLKAIAYASGSADSDLTSGTYTISSATTTTNVGANDTVWVEDAVPGGAGTGTTDGGSWTWIESNPAPFSGTKAHQSALSSGLYEQFFNWASTRLPVRSGEVLITHVFLDPANPPREIMLSWHSGTNWEHRAYWGANLIQYGTDGTSSRRYMGPLPAAGQWVRLEVPASAVALEGANMQGMAFSIYGGRVTWDRSGTAPAPTDTTTTEPVSTPTETSTPPPTTTTPDTTVIAAENTAVRHPQIGDHQLSIVSPTVLELRRITTKQPDPATVTEWNFVSSTGTFTAPATSKFAVTINGQTVSVKSVGFRRRVAYAPLNVRDLRIENALFLELSAAVPEGAQVEVRNPDATLWPATMPFKSTAHVLRYSPAIHVNQEGYVPSFPKKAMVGYYLGNLGEMPINPSGGFRIVSVATGATVFSGLLTLRQDTGFRYSPLPYQNVYQADFSSLTVPGEYQLVVPGLGASLPFVIDEGVAMAFTRTYALGLYHQRCGTACALPFTRFTHAPCHTAPAEVPSPESSYSFTWTTIASRNADAKNNPRHTAPQLKDEASQLYPFVHKGTVDVRGGYHDAGDYSKYTINVAKLVHHLTFTADAIAGAGALDNLGLPESGDGISDILQKAKHEADYLAKLQDADGGFYFIVYPKNRAYEHNVAPDRGDPQVVWPKNTAATAAGVAALAEIASSPRFRAAYPTAAAQYLEKAKAGWQFLLNAINRFGKDGSYQKITFYGDNYMHDDELAWAAAALFAATGEAQYHQRLMEWFPDPASSSTFRWGWWRLSEGWGNAIRTYAFAARSGRLPASALNTSYLGACENQIRLAGDDALRWSSQSAYGTSFPEASKQALGAGWYFSLDQAADMAVAYQLNPRFEYIDALVANLNYEAGTNPVNAMFLTGLGLKRQREIVHQWANNNRQTLPMPGIPIGNVTGHYSYLGTYGASGNELTKLSFPTDSTASPGTMYPFYDRWADTWNVNAEFIAVNQARGLLSSAMLAGHTAARSTAWKPSTTARIVVPTTTVAVGEPVTVSLDTAGLNLAGARVVWEARDQEPDFGLTYTITPRNSGPQWVEVEITWADGRRMVGINAFEADSPVLVWVDDAIPTGATPLGNEGWNWVASNPTPCSGTVAHQTAPGTGLREHAFNGAWNPLPVGTGDTLFAWVYLDPAAMPEEIMISWNDGSWEHRAYWGANKILYGTDGTASRRRMGPLPAGGSWVKLEVPASAVALEGRNVIGMSFSTYGGGRVTWDAAGRSRPLN
jgi:hypothetical protein